MITIKIKNLDKLIKGLEVSANELKYALSTAVKKSVFLVERESKKVTPVDTGRLRASITPNYLKPLEGALGPHTEYAIFVHEGTRYMKARPFMKKGVEEALPEIEDVFMEEIDKILKKI